MVKNIFNNRIFLITILIILLLNIFYICNKFNIINCDGFQGKTVDKEAIYRFDVI